MKKTISIILIAAFAAVLGTSTYFIVRHNKEADKQAELYRIKRRFYLHTHSGIVFRTLSFSRMTDFRGRPSTDRVSSKWRTWWNRAW